jgi:hypothetical protein
VVLVAALAGCRFDTSGAPLGASDRRGAREVVVLDRSIRTEPRAAADAARPERPTAADSAVDRPPVDKPKTVDQPKTVDSPKVLDQPKLADKPKLADTKPPVVDSKPLIVDTKPLVADVMPPCAGSCAACGGCCAGGCCKAKYAGSALSCSKSTCTCVFDCASYGGTCDLVCSGGATCLVDCKGAKECQPRCSGGSTCIIDCRGVTSECVVKECSGNSQCLLYCAGAPAGECKFDPPCPTALKACGNSVYACGRPCP